MSIWFTKPDLDIINAFGKNTLVSHIDIRFIEIGDDFIKATMPVDNRTHQPMGILHGGASVVLSETLASTGAYLCVDPSVNYCVGLEINANHIRSMRTGLVTGFAKPAHLGRTTQIWEVKITDEQDRLICISRVTMAVLTHAK
ncbi:Phenylacetic acid degradation-related protein [Desulfonema limicola]|uniref:Phenylacetic acid degradation-related protein n=1 Tax=Desulfonema limicola TaxID=45656 RepID=A0A975BAP7_9BACT|nr:hotdog fold thioesterase [Desulfonema limicola]QTA81876.1 Phenylacetic acid degradation-related protein [Desulfonema limicola]